MKQTEQIISHLIQNMSNDTSLVIVSDHGRDDVRDHGGNSLGELHTVFAMYQKGNTFEVDPMSKSILSQGKLRVISFMSLASTISNILQTSIPFSNVGAFRPEYLVYDDDASNFDIHKDVFKSVLLNELQITKYIEHYIAVAHKIKAQKGVIHLMEQFLHELKQNKDKMFEILSKIQSESQKNGQTTNDEIIKMIQSYQTVSFSDKVEKFDNELNELWSIPNSENNYYLFAIAIIFFLVLQPVITCTVKY